MLYTNDADLVAMRGGKSIKKSTLFAALLVFGPAPAFAAPLLLTLPSAPQTPQALPVPPAPLLPPAELRVKPPQRFDRSLESLERNQIITPQERRTLERGAVAKPIDVPRFQQACRSGALSKRECARANDGTVIFEGGSLSSFAREHNVSLSELRSLNPGLDLARLHEGMEVRIAKPSSYFKELKQKREQIKHDQDSLRREDAARASAQRAKANAERARAENERMEREALSRINRAKQTIQNSY